VEGRDLLKYINVETDNIKMKLMEVGFYNVNWIHLALSLRQFALFTFHSSLFSQSIFS